MTIILICMEMGMSDVSLFFIGFAAGVVFCGLLDVCRYFKGK
jgi:hypothetical protein